MKRLFTFIFTLAILAISCGQSTDQIGTLIPQGGGQVPYPSLTPTIEGLFAPGTYLVGSGSGQIAPGVYIGMGDSCYWERLSGLGGTLDEIITNDGVDGQFYVEIKETDKAFTINRCSILPLYKVLAPTSFLTHLDPGMYIIGRDIQAGLYQGNGESCYWERLENVDGSLDGIIANDGTNGNFFVQIAPTDFAFSISRCSVDLVQN
jgi:hypothetical protein